MKNRKVETKEENETEILSLSGAAKIAGYTPEYLNLLARKGKLKAQKIGRNWFTKKEYLDELRLVLYREKNGIKFPSELQEEDRLQEAETIFLDGKKKKK